MHYLSKVCAHLDKHHIPYALVGGHALAFHGAARGTYDIDFIIRFREQDFINLEAALSEIGFRPRLPVIAQEVFQFRKEYIERRNLIAWSFVNQSNPLELVDIILTENLEKLSIVNKDLGGLKIKVLSKKDLINMKKRAGRPQDLIDIQALEGL